MFTVTTRLTLWYLLNFGIIIVAVALVMYIAYSSNERASFDAELRDYAQFLVLEVTTRGTDMHDLLGELREVTTQANRRFRFRHFMLTTSDSIFYESAQVQGMEPLVDSLRKLIPTFDGNHFMTIPASGTDYRVFSMAVRRHMGQSLGMVVVAPLTALQESLSRLGNLFLIIVPSAIFIAGIGGWFMARRALAPVSKIISAALNISSSNLHERVPQGSSNDELTTLARTFNDMIARIEETFASQRRFVADASHDLRTPLMVIQAKLDRLLRTPGLEPSVREDLRHCSGEVDRLSRLASDLLLLAKADTHQLKLARAPERLDEMLVECVGRMNTLANDRDISLWVDIDEPVEVICDAPTLQRVLMNILDNAITHSPESSTVMAHLGLRDGCAAITISDTGPGIPEEHLPKIFDRFYRSDGPRSTPGSGLGLAIAKTIIEAHGGTIQLASTPASGTVVTILLPPEYESEHV